MKVLSKNKHHYNSYAIEHTYDAGIVLRGHEVKALKSGKVNIKDAIIFFEGKSLYVLNMDIPLYEKTSLHQIGGNYNAKGKRYILLTKSEIIKIAGKIQKGGYRLIVLEIYIGKSGIIKLKFGLGKLLNKVDKKALLKEKDWKKDLKNEIAGI